MLFKRFLLTRISQVEFDAIDKQSERNEIKYTMKVSTYFRNSLEKNQPQETRLKLSCADPRVGRKESEKCVAHAINIIQLVP